MVRFGFGRELPHEQRGYTVAVTACDVDDYIYTLQALIRLVQAADPELVGKDEVSYVLDLVQQMLPTSEQLKF